MVLSISISKETESKLATRARAAGVDVSTYISTLVEQTAKAPPSITEISGAIAADFARSGLTDDQFAELLEDVKHEMRDEERGRAEK